MMILRSSTSPIARDLAHDVGFLSLLVADNHRSVQVLRIGMGTLGSAHVGRGDRQILHLQILHIGNENAARIQMIDRNVEKPLNLIGVQIHRHDPVDARARSRLATSLAPIETRGRSLRS